MNTLFDALCGVFDRAAAGRAEPLPEAYVAFLGALETHLSVNHTVRELVHRPLQVRVGGAIDLAHAALPDQADDLIPTEVTSGR